MSTITTTPPVKTAPISLTPNAVSKVKEIMAQQNPVPAGERGAGDAVRVGRGDGRGVYEPDGERLFPVQADGGDDAERGYADACWHGGQRYEQEGLGQAGR